MDIQSKARVLFVDDEVRIVNLLRVIFRDDYEVFTATSAAQALQILEDRNIDVLVSDQRMPGMTGVQLLSKARELSPATMRVLLTGYSDLTAIVGSINEGEIFRFINKPWDTNALIKVVAEAALAAQSTQLTSQFVRSAEIESPEPSVLLLGKSLHSLEVMSSVLSGDNTLTALSVQEALLRLEFNDVGVIVADSQSGDTEFLDFLSLLKSKHPSITTVMLSDTTDSELVIRLINEAQIFRFAFKPLRRGAFRLAVASAMQAHKHLVNNPDLLVRHRVEENQNAFGGALLSAVSRGIKRIRTRLMIFGTR